MTLNQFFAVCSAVNARFKTRLILPPPGLFEQSLLQTAAPDGYRPALIRHYFPEALALYRQLNARKTECGLVPAPLPDPAPDANPAIAGAFRDWLMVRQLENKLKGLKEELEQVQAQLQHTRHTAEECSNNSLGKSVENHS